MEAHFYCSQPNCIQYPFLVRIHRCWLLYIVFARWASWRKCQKKCVNKCGCALVEQQPLIIHVGNDWSCCSEFSRCFYVGILFSWWSFCIRGSFKPQYNQLEFNEKLWEKKTGFTRVPQVLTINMLCVNAQWKSMVKIKTSGFHLETSNYIYKLAATSFVWYITFPYTFLTVALPTGPSMWNQVYRCSRILLHSHMHVPTQTHTHTHVRYPEKSITQQQPIHRVQSSIEQVEWFVCKI